jgi:hypothetical protein
MRRKFFLSVYAQLGASQLLRPQKGAAQLGKAQLGAAKNWLRHN